MDNQELEAMNNENDQDANASAAEAASEIAPTEDQSPERDPFPAPDNPVMELALKELQSRRDELSAEITLLTNRKQQLDAELKTSFAGQSDAIARRVKGFQEYLGGALQDLSLIHI